MKSILKNLFLLLFIILLTVCTSVQNNNKSGNSYYVQANGSDSNQGTSESAPFKTLTKALETASMSTIKKITVIGTLIGETSTEHLTPVWKRETQQVKFIDIDRRKDRNTQTEFIFRDYIQLKGSYDEPHPHEILITGKANANSKEKAVLTSNTSALLIFNCAIRLENIEISGCQGSLSAINVFDGDLTLAKGTKIIKNKSEGEGSISASGSTIIMRDNAEISYNESINGAGIYLYNESIAILLDNALITNNKAKKDGGGIAVIGSSLIMKNNSTISYNSADGGGGGIITSPDIETVLYSHITISDNASVIRNTAKNGGGIFLEDILILQGTVQITENTAFELCGGIGVTESALIVKGDKVILKNNRASGYINTNYIF